MIIFVTFLAIVCAAGAAFMSFINFKLLKNIQTRIYRLERKFIPDAAPSDFM